ncbi:MAG: redox-sensing transcriptional repressor Rex [Armatimonadetes bacterium]|nr:redox-sensing transcriptional repressor Rex [Armatimonadota bacterium]MDE2205576.1 redox-sensing transcriptional repressor Rex [Armatimonadota bacterium]
MNTSGKVPLPTLERLASYLRLLIDLEQAQTPTISSADIERQTGINAAQFRKDLSYFGEFGRPGVGYEVSDLRHRIAVILRVDTEQPVVLIGAGNLGSALAGYPGLMDHNFRLEAVFDNNIGKIGRVLWHLTIRDIEDLVCDNAEIRAQLAIIAVPAAAAQAVADRAVEAGITAILNFAPVPLRAPPGVFIRHVSFLRELAVLSYHLRDDKALLAGSAATMPPGTV